MKKASLKRRLGGVCSALSSLLLVSGCHYNYNSGQSSTPGYGGYDSISAPPFLRSAPQESYDGTPQPPTPQNAPSVLPMPGYSEPTEAPVPPSPSVQRSRWNLFQNGLKFPSFIRQNSQANHLPSKASNTDFSHRATTSKSTVSAPQFSSAPASINRSTVMANVAEENQAPVRSVSKQDDVDQDETPKTRKLNKVSGDATRQWPAAKASPRTTANDTEASDSNGSSAPKFNSNVRANPGDAPMLLPPPL